MSNKLIISHLFYLNYISTKNSYKQLEATSIKELQEKIVDAERRTVYMLRVKKVEEDLKKQIGKISTDFSGILVGTGELRERLERYKE